VSVRGALCWSLARRERAASRPRGMASGGSSEDKTAVPHLPLLASLVVFNHHLSNFRPRTTIAQNQA
jgi:hypothetical protein